MRNIIEQVEFDEIQDKIKGINMAIEAGILYDVYKAEIEPRLDALLERRDKFVRPPKGA